LGLVRAPAVIAIVGGGGKSSLMFALGHGLPGRVVMTTTTRIFAAQMDVAPEACSTEEAGWEEKLDSFESSLLIVGGTEGKRAVGVPPALPAELLARKGVDWVVVEADGSRMLPVKAPAAHEPVIPDGTDLLVAIAGIDALTKPIDEIAHRPELVSEIVGLPSEHKLTPEALAMLLTSERGGLKDAAQAARAAVLINKVESPPEWEAARRVARSIVDESRVERVAIGALKGRSASGWEVWSR
jgi:molybdenum cofactor cytidylyltransferase